MIRTLWRKLLGSKFTQKQRRPSDFANRFVPQIEALEERTLLAGTWTPLASLAPSPSGTGTPLLLSDGSIMIEGGGVSKNWYKLTPNAAGSYVNGTWTALAPMGLERLYFASDVLKDGRVLVVGGEYSGPLGAANWTSTGEIYNPVTNTWTAIPPVPSPVTTLTLPPFPPSTASHFGDDPSEMLPNGNVLTGDITGAQTYIYNPTTNTWSAGPTKLAGDASDEETWVKLPGNIDLSYNIFGNPQNAQRFEPATNTWVASGAVPVTLQNAVDELGSAYRLPNGNVFFIGATSNTALYTPSATAAGTGSWVAGPVTPGGLGANDAPGDMMPNGHVLYLAGTTPAFGTMTSVFEYDPVSNTTVPASAPPPALAAVLNSVPPFVCRLINLPSGQVLLSDSTNQLWVYNPNGAPANAWRPTILSVTPTGGNTYTMTGTQLNGISEGSGYGDDVQDATNYPIVRVTNPATGKVTYARTFNWSSVDVATGNAIVSTQFTLPAGFVLNGTEPIVVIANGIPSLSFFTTSSIRIFYPLRYTDHADTGFFTGNLSLVNTGSGTPNSFTLTFPKLPPGVTLVNATGYDALGHPYITVSATLKPKGSLLVPIVLTDPFDVALSTFFIGFPIVLS